MSYDQLIESCFRNFGLNILFLVSITLVGIIATSLLSADSRRFLPFLIFWSFSEIAALISGILFKNNSAVYHIHTIVAIFFIGYYYYTQMRHLPEMKWIFYAGSSSMLLLWLINLAYFQGWDRMPTNTILFTAVYFIFLVLMSFKQMLDKPSSDKILGQSRFWLNTGLLIFYASSFFFFAVHAYFISQPVPSPQFLGYFMHYPNWIWLIMIGMALFVDLRRNFKNKTKHLEH